MNPPVTAVVSRRFAFPAECVFDAWLDPEWIGRWMYGPAGHAGRILRLGVEPRVGGRFSFTVDRQGLLVDHVGEYLEIDRPTLLVFTWGTRDARTPASRVVVELVACDGGCELTLTHVLGAHQAACAAETAEAWRRKLGALAAALAATHSLSLNSK